MSKNAKKEEKIKKKSKSSKSESAKKVKRQNYTEIFGDGITEKDSPDVRTIKDAIRTIPDYPKKGVMFRDITTLWKSQKEFRLSIGMMLEKMPEIDEFDAIAAIEARGWVYGAILADETNKPFIPIRKSGKLPSNVLSVAYGLEYGKDQVEIHADAISEGQRIVLVDDLIATGGSTEAAAKLIAACGGMVIQILALMELKGLKGKEYLRNKGYKVHTCIKYPGK